MTYISLFFAARLSTGVEIPDEGVPTWTWSYGMQYTTRTEKRPAAITNEAMYLKWKWRMNLANSATGLDNDALRDGVKKIVAESGWKAGKEDWYDVAARCFDFLVDNVAIGFSKYDGFPAISAWDRHKRPMSAVLWSHAADVDDKYSPGHRARIAQMALDALHRATEKNLDLYSESVLLYMLSTLCRANKVHHDLLSQIVTLSNDRFSEADFSLAVLAGELGYDAKYLSAFFKKKKGIPFTQFLRELRVKHALFLMEQGVVSVKNIAILAGFGDALYFSKIFKESVGIPPKNYIENLQKGE